ncbi:MAG: hypothetical protein Q7S59_06895 [Sulfurimonas sp.]|nr:hypothetical protein [Sulfurimonas sp.]
MKKVFIVVSSKGGVGKSTFSSNFLAPYAYTATNNSVVNFVEIDDENANIELLSDSKIIKANLVKLENSKDFLFESAIAESAMIIDCGGNKTAISVLMHLKSISFLTGNEVYIIPLKSSEQDLKNGLDTYKKIREFDTEGKIIFILNEAMKLDSPTEFLYFFGDPRLRLKGKWDSLKKDKNTSYIKVQKSELIETSTFLRKTIFELADMDTVQLQEEAKAAHAAGNRDEALYKIRLREIANSSKVFKDEELARIFKELDEILK